MPCMQQGENPYSSSTQEAHMEIVYVCGHKARPRSVRDEYPKDSYRTSLEAAW